MRKFSLAHISQNEQDDFKEKLNRFLEEKHAESKSHKGKRRSYEELLRVDLR
jgi:hypothetical protein